MTAARPAPPGIPLPIPQTFLDSPHTFSPHCGHTTMSSIASSPSGVSRVIGSRSGQTLRTSAAKSAGARLSMSAPTIHVGKPTSTILAWTRRAWFSRTPASTAPGPSDLVGIVMVRADRPVSTKGDVLVVEPGTCATDRPQIVMCHTPPGETVGFAACPGPGGLGFDRLPNGRAALAVTVDIL